MNNLRTAFIVALFAMAIGCSDDDSLSSNNENIENVDSLRFYISDVWTQTNANSGRYNLLGFFLDSSYRGYVVDTAKDTIRAQVYEGKWYAKKDSLYVLKSHSAFYTNGKLTSKKTISGGYDTTRLRVSIANDILTIYNGTVYSGKDTTIILKFVKSQDYYFPAFPN